MTEQKNQRESADLKAHRDQEQRVNTRVEQPVRGSGEFVSSDEEALERGFYGEKVDPRPNSDYTGPAAK